MELTTLSWMLLVADRASTIGEFLAVFSLLFLVFVIARGCIVRFDTEIKEKELKILPLWTVVLLLGWGVPAIIVNLIPSNVVIMQVAAIELGDDVLNSPEFQRILEIYIPKEQ